MSDYNTAAGQRCGHMANIREFFAACKEAGLDSTEKAAMRAAVGMFLGRRIRSRADLTGREWALCCSAVRAGRLFW